MGLGKILVFSTFSGISLAFSWRASGDTLEFGLVFVILNWVYQYVDIRLQGLVMIISLVVTIFFIYGMAVFIRQVYEQRLVGIVTAILGFTGSLLVFSSTQNVSFYIVLGISVWIIGGIIVCLRGKRK